MSIEIWIIIALIITVVGLIFFVGFLLDENKKQKQVNKEVTENRDYVTSELIKSRRECNYLRERASARSKD